MGLKLSTAPRQVLSLPIVVIVHGNQDNNAKATVLWDNAFSEIVSTAGWAAGGRGRCRTKCTDADWPPQERVPFVVAERVPWEKMCETLNLKFMAEVQTTKGLLKEHYFFLAQKIFNDHSAAPEDFQSRSVSWAQFNKVRVGGLCCGGESWGVSVALGPSQPSCVPGDPAWTGLHLLAVVRWSPGPHQAVPQELLVRPVGAGMEHGGWGGGTCLSVRPSVPSVCPHRLIIGFISKQYVCKLLSTEPDGTFLLRFSDSEIGGVTIAHVIRGKDGELGRAAPRWMWGRDAVLCPAPPHRFQPGGEHSAFLC